MKRAHAIPMTSDFERDALTMAGAVALEPVQTEQEKLEFQIGFYGLAHPAKQQEIEAHVAARLLAIPVPIQVPIQLQKPDGRKTDFPQKREDEILGLLLNRGENRETKQPLTEWLRRAREHNIIYLTALDLAVTLHGPKDSEPLPDSSAHGASPEKPVDEVVLREARPQFREFEVVQHDESPPECLRDQALEAALKALDSVPEITENSSAHGAPSEKAVHKNTPGPKLKVVDAQQKVRLAATKFFAGNENAWNATQYPAWKILNMVEVIREVWGVEAKQLPRNDAKDKDKFKVERKVNLREMCNAVNSVRPLKPVEN